MLGLIVRRLAAMVPVILIVTFAVFMLSALVPGDPAVTLAGGVEATPDRIEKVRTQLGLDDPLLVQYGRWFSDAVQLDFGHSLFSDQTTVAEDIKERLPVTMSIALAALLVAVLVGLPVGIIAGLRPGALPDRMSVTGTAMGLAIPNFVLAMVLIVVFAINRDWFPALGYVKFSESPSEWLDHIVLPALALGLVASASLARQVRGAIIDVLGSNYVRTAWATGLSPARVIGKHALKNAAIPAVTALALQFSVLLGGSAIIERIFSIPGLGTYLLNALYLQDLPVIQGVVIVFAVLYMATNLLLDIVYGYLNPKIRVT